MNLQIRPYQESDMNKILDIWLEASIIAHPFISARIWKDNLEPMRNLYLPSSEIHVACLNETPIGFIALVENQIAALFVEPYYQNGGAGKMLLKNAQNNWDELSLKVFQKNKRAVQFYIAQGFQIQDVQLDENFQEMEFVMSWNKNSPIGIPHKNFEKITAS